MPRLTWAEVGTRTYENGVDQGVLYLPDGTAVPWSGLTQVNEKPERDTNPIHFDGRKVSNGISVGDFSAAMSAVTYPRILEELEGGAKLRRGVLVNDQPPKPFALCYRTMVNSDTVEALGYKIHVIWNVMAMPQDKQFASISDDPELVEFEWDLVAVPQRIPGFRPSAHVTIDTRDLDPWLLEEVETMLYGGTLAEASLIPMADFLAFLDEWYRVKITDNGDGTWTATEKRPGFITIHDATDVFTIVKVKVSYLDEDTFVISDTKDVMDVGRITVNDHGDGTWSAVTDDDNVIVTNPDGTFEIRSIDVTIAGPDMYRIATQTTEH